MCRRLGCEVLNSTCVFEGKLRFNSNRCCETVQSDGRKAGYDAIVSKASDKDNGELRSPPIRRALLVLTLDARYHPNNISVVSLVKLIDPADSIKCVVLTATSLLKGIDSG